MGVPTFLNSSYRYFCRVGVSDVQQIINDFQAEVLANTPAWTNPSAGLYKSPVDADGRWMDVLLTKISASKLEMRLRDQLGQTLCTRRINNTSGAGNAWTVHIITGQYHMNISVDSGTGWEGFGASMLDQTPEAQGSNARYVCGGGLRSNSDVIDSYWSAIRWFMMDNNAAAYAERVTQWYCTISAAALFTLNGTRIIRPMGHVDQARRADLLPQVPRPRLPVRARRDGIATGSKLTLPIDVGLSGLFFVAAVPTGASSKVAIRIG